VRHYSAQPGSTLRISYVFLHCPRTIGTQHPFENLPAPPCCRYQERRERSTEGRPVDTLESSRRTRRHIDRRGLRKMVSAGYRKKIGTALYYTLMPNMA